MNTSQVVSITETASERAAGQPVTGLTIPASIERAWANIVAAMEDWGKARQVGEITGLVRFSTIADAYASEEDNEANHSGWWSVQVDRWGKTVDPYVGEFWRLVAEVKGDGDYDHGSLVEALAQKPFQEIIRFHNALRQVQSLAYTDEHVGDMMNAVWWFGRGFFSPVTFEYTINGLVLLGEATYRHILQAPEKLLGVEPYQISDKNLGNVAQEAFERKAGREGADVGFWFSK